VFARRGQEIIFSQFHTVGNLGLSPGAKAEDDRSLLCRI
jgi:hypothetical protein